MASRINILFSTACCMKSMIYRNFCIQIKDLLYYRVTRKSEITGNVWLVHWKYCRLEGSTEKMFKSSNINVKVFPHPLNILTYGGLWRWDKVKYKNVREDSEILGLWHLGECFPLWNKPGKWHIMIIWCTHHQEGIELSYSLDETDQPLFFSVLFRTLKVNNSYNKRVQVSMKNRSNYNMCQWQGTQKICPTLQPPKNLNFDFLKYCYEMRSQTSSPYLSISS